MPTIVRKIIEAIYLRDGEVSSDLRDRSSVVVESMVNVFYGLSENYLYI
jgi:hypothetical protein